MDADREGEPGEAPGSNEEGRVWPDLLSQGDFRICVSKPRRLQGRLWPRAGEAPTSREKASFSGKVLSLRLRWPLCSAPGTWAREAGVGGSQFIRGGSPPLGKSLN